MKNFIIRTLSGLAFTILVIGSILYGPVAFAVVFGTIMVAAVWEYLNITMGKGNLGETLLARTFTMVAAVALFVNMFLVVAYGYDPLYLLFAVLPVMGIFISNMYVKSYNVHQTKEVDGKVERVPNGYETYPFTLGALVYVALPFSLMSLLLYDKTGVYNGNMLLSLMVMLWCTDVGAYLLGSTLGQMFGHRLFPSISPKKSWEGFFGGLVCSVAGAVVLRVTGLLELSLADAIAVGVIICIFGVLGDLVESQLKRNFGVKDSGRIMPGHGGMLDRFDGALLAFPVAIVYIIFFTA
ncbi:MAG: phosphatidate cytidylyltransferase [Bacteroidales bacterium]|nr:phosphatidate cytidylyltransferase [Bacteroidales bacterium]